nr:retrovirus-related Pol polyprotein from transposon TNT 1-94 [Tanacetum cinerariifolium]
MNKRKPNIKFFRVFGCRCYLLNDSEDVGKLKAKGDIGVFVGYSKESAVFRIYNKRSRKIHESVNVNFDEISEMASKIQFRTRVTVLIHQASSLAPPLSTPIIDLTPPKPIDNYVNEIFKETVQDALQAPVHERFRELSEFEMKEILHDRMFKSGSYISHPKYAALYDALEMHLNRAFSSCFSLSLLEEMEEDLGRHGVSYETWLLLQ